MSPPIAEGQDALSGRAWRVLRQSALVLLLTIAGFWLFGAVLFLRADGSVDYTLPRYVRPPTGEHNLASYRYGPRLRASSYFHESGAQHHPMWLVDEQPVPDLKAKWASDQRDPSPWVSIAWREPRRLLRVRIEHAGTRERPQFTARTYRLRCLQRDGFGSELMVRGNRQHVAEHPLVCDRALGVRIDFLRKKSADIVRVFEVQAWGL
jgi:hypothetical protein